jgi:hypothetical protein
MTPVDIFGIFFMLAALQPALRLRTLEILRMRRIGQLERLHDSRVIPVVHREETMRCWDFRSRAISASTLPKRCSAPFN